MRVNSLTAVARLLCAGLLMLCVQVSAQDAPVVEEPVVVADEFNRGTPSRSAEGFLAAADMGDFETAAQYLDLRNIHGAAAELSGIQLARRLDVIIERAEWLDIDELADDPAGRSNDGLPGYRDSIGVVRNGSEKIRLLMQNVPRADGEKIWKVSNATVSQIPALYESYGYSEQIEELRRNLPAVSFLGLELFKWVAALAAGMVAYGVVLLIALVVRRWLGDSNKDSHRQLFRYLMVPVAIGAVLVTMNKTVLSLGLGTEAASINRLSPVSPLIFVWVVFAGIDLVRDVYSGVLLGKGRPGVQVLLRPISSAAKLLVFIVVLLIYLDGVGINITTLLAGLGVGGVAVALALQKPMEDMFGAITLYTQQPVRVGDFCRIGDTTGTIEEIGLRTTSIRTLKNTLIAVPNSKLASEAIDNISRRQKILYRTKLRIRYDTEPQQIEDLMSNLRALLENNERIIEGHRVRFVEIAEDALKIEIYCYFDCKAWDEYLGLAELLNLSVLGVIEKSGTRLANPLGTLHLDAAAGRTAAEP